VIRGTGPIGYPGGAEVVNMHPPTALIRAGIDALPCIGDGRQSGTSGSPSILNASPEAATGGGLALLRTGDRIRIDLRRREVNVLVDAEELTRRRTVLGAQGGYAYPASQTPWQEIQRGMVEQFDEGMVLKVDGALYYGADAIHALAAMGGAAGAFNRINRWLFGSRSRARILYPLLRSGRNLLLKALGRTRINNLQLPGKERF